MTQFDLKIHGMKELQRSLKLFPIRARTLFSRAINAGLAELHNESDDRNFQFKTPRGGRTGLLQSSFAHGIKLARKTKLEGRIGPTKHYAIYIHEGTRRGIKANRFMPRIMKAAEKRIIGHFEKALEKLISQTAK